MLKKEEYTIDIENLQYCYMTVVYNKSPDIFERVERFYNWSGEYIITQHDTIILEYNNQILELYNGLEKNYLIAFNYYNFGMSHDIFPKSIIKDDPSVKKKIM